MLLSLLFAPKAPTISVTSLGISGDDINLECSGERIVEFFRSRSKVSAGNGLVRVGACVPRMSIAPLKLVDSGVVVGFLVVVVVLVGVVVVVVSIVDVVVDSFAVSLVVVFVVVVCVVGACDVGNGLVLVTLGVVLAGGAKASRSFNAGNR